jgi:hypothetical protein
MWYLPARGAGGLSMWYLPAGGAGLSTCGALPTLAGNWRKYQWPASGIIPGANPAAQPLGLWYRSILQLQPMLPMLQAGAPSAINLTGSISTTCSPQQRRPEPMSCSQYCQCCKAGPQVLQDCVTDDLLGATGSRYR